MKLSLIRFNRLINDFEKATRKHAFIGSEELFARSRIETEFRDAKEALLGAIFNERENTVDVHGVSDKVRRKSPKRCSSNKTKSTKKSRRKPRRVPKEVRIVSRIR